MRGDVVIVCLGAEQARVARARGYLWRGGCASGVAPIGKYVLAVEGDTVDLTRQGFTVNRRRVLNTTVLEEDGRGRRMVHFPYGTYVVKPGKLWTCSAYHPRSYDSRYFGPVLAHQVLARVRSWKRNRRPNVGAC